MKKYNILIFILVLFALLFLLTGCSNKEEQFNDNLENTIHNNSETSSNINEQYAENRVANILQNSNEILQNSNEILQNDIINETEISSYATTIKDKEAGRLTNISITCSTINNTIIKPGETFSFNNIVGKPTPERGYQEASVIIDHKTERGIGGGNCQVSSTLYNAVLNIPKLTIVERHEHGKDVTYVPEGKDAAVSFGSLDLKFRNDTENNIRIDATSDNQTITIKLIQL